MCTQPKAQKCNKWKAKKPLSPKHIQFSDLEKVSTHRHPGEVVDISLENKLLSPPVLTYLSWSCFSMILWEAIPRQPGGQWASSLLQNWHGSHFMNHKFGEHMSPSSLNESYFQPILTFSELYIRTLIIQGIVTIAFSLEKVIERTSSWQPSDLLRMA